MIWLWNRWLSMEKSKKLTARAYKDHFRRVLSLGEVILKKDTQET